MLFIAALCLGAPFCTSKSTESAQCRSVERLIGPLDRLELGDIEPREVLYGMQWRDGLAKHCGKIGVKWDANDLEGSVRRVIEHYKK